MVTIADIDFSYPDNGFRLRIPELEIAPGEKLAIIGPSGSGKTTLLNLISGIYSCEGTVLIADKTVNKLPDGARRAFRSEHIGFVFQDFELLEYLSVWDNIVHLFRITPVLKLTEEIKGRAATLAADLGIGDKLDKKPAQLSQGERQRAAICRALLHNPGLILADEATGNLDPPNKSKILDILFEQTEKSGATLIAVTHDHSLLDRFDRVLDFQEFATYEA